MNKGEHVIQLISLHLYFFVRSRLWPGVGGWGCTAKPRDQLEAVTEIQVMGMLSCTSAWQWRWREVT